MKLGVDIRSAAASGAGINCSLCPRVSGTAFAVRCGRVRASCEEISSAMTILWFVVWLVANSIGGKAPLLFDPVNGWTATLIVAIGLDLSAAHARNTKKS